jgi:hypothetical protein
MINFEDGSPEVADAMIAVGEEYLSSLAKRGILMSRLSGPDCSETTQPSPL